MMPQRLYTPQLMVYTAFFELPISNTDAAKETSSKRSITTEELA